MSNFVARFEAHVARDPQQPALILPEGGGWSERSYAQVHERVMAAAAGLRDQVGLKPGQRVMMLVPAGFEFFELSLALWKLGCVPVLIDPGMGMEGFLSCVAQVQPQALIAIPKGMLLSKIKGAAFSSVQERVTVNGWTWFWGGHQYSACLKPGVEVENHDSGPDSLAAILFTSGSTGPAKGVRYTHGMFSTQADRIAAMYGIEPGQVEVSCFLPFAMFSMAMGSTCVLPDMDFAKPATASPAKIQAALDRFKADQLVASPAVLAKMAVELPAKGQRLESLKRVLTFGAPIPRTLHLSFREILAEGAEIHTPYGATESLPVATIASSEILNDTGARSAAGEGTCVGRVDASIRVEILPITDEPILQWDPQSPLPVGEVGEICVQGPQASKGYFERPEANRAAKIPDGGGFWHRMGDVGYLDAEGRLWFCGRKSHRVQTATGDVFPVPLEGVYNEHPAVRRSAVVSVDSKAVLVVELKPGHSSGEALGQEILALGSGRAVCSVISALYFHGAFPVDRRHNAKIHRPELGTWAANQKPAAVLS